MGLTTPPRKKQPRMNSAEAQCSDLPGFKGKYSSKGFSNPQIQELPGHTSERRKDIHIYKTPFGLFHQFSGKEKETLRSQRVKDASMSQKVNHS